MKSETVRPARSAYVLCIENGDYAGELTIGKVYRTVRADKGDRSVDLRVIDESGEDYLYPAKWFVSLALPPRAKRALART